MKKLLVFLFVLAIVGIGVGFQRGWFALSSPTAEAGSQQVNVNLATDTGKMRADGEKVKDKAEELTGRTQAPATPVAPPAADQPPISATSNDR